MHWIVDGMNVMGSRPDGWWRDRVGARRRLVGELGVFSSYTGDWVQVVFDGREKPGEIAAAVDAGVELSFAAGGPNAADRVIAEMARALEDPSATTVVTSDGALADEIRSIGAEIMGASTFRRRLETMSSPSD